ncbi:hypothetical protein D3C86_885600 [compost metagenome]
MQEILVNFDVHTKIVQQRVAVTIQIVVFVARRRDPFDAITDAPVVPGEGHVSGSRKLRRTDGADFVVDRIGVEQRAVTLGHLGDADVQQRRARTNVAAVAQGVIQTLHHIRRDVDVAIKHAQSIGRSVALDEGAVARISRKVRSRRVVAHAQDVARTDTRNAVLHFDFVVIDCERQIPPTRRQSRLEDRANRQVVRGLGPQTGISAARSDHADALILHEVCQTFGSAVGDPGRVRGSREFAARIVRTGDEAAGRADELLEQRRSAVGSAVGAAQRQPVHWGVNQTDLIGGVVAVGVIVGVARRGVERQRLCQRHVGQQGNFDLAEDFPDAVRTAGDTCRGEPEDVAGLHVQAGGVVDGSFTPLSAEEGRNFTCRHLEQRTVEADADDLLVILRGAGHRTENIILPVFRQLAADRRGRQERCRDTTDGRINRVHAAGHGARHPGGQDARAGQARIGTGRRLDDVKRVLQQAGDELLEHVARVRLRIAGRNVVAPFRDEEITAHADDLLVEVDFLLAVIQAVTNECAHADTSVGERSSRRAETLVSREVREGQVLRDQQAAPVVVKRQLAITDLRRLTVVVQDFTVEFRIAQSLQIIGALSIKRRDFSRRDQRFLQHIFFEGVADRRRQSHEGSRVVAVVQEGAADAFKARHARRHGRVRTPTVEEDAVGVGLARDARRADQTRTQGNPANRGHEGVSRQVAGADRVDRHAAAVSRIALGAARQRVDVVRTINITIGGATCEITGAQRQFLAVVVLGGSGEVPAVAAGAGHDRDTRLLAFIVGVGRGVELTLNGDAIDIVARDDVHDAGHGVRAVDRRGPVLQDFDALDHGGRQDVQVSRADRTARTGRSDATAVQQQQGAGGAQAAQRQGVRARSAVGDEAAVGVVDLVRAAADGGALQNFRGRGEAGERAFLTGHDLDRRRRVVVVATQTRTDDDDFFNRRGLVLGLIFILGGLREGRSRCGDDAREDRRPE